MTRRGNAIGATRHRRLDLKFNVAGFTPKRRASDRCRFRVKAKARVKPPRGSAANSLSVVDLQVDAVAPGPRPERERAPTPQGLDVRLRRRSGVRGAIDNTRAGRFSESSVPYGDRSAGRRVEDRLHVVTVGVEQEGAVVARRVLRPRARRAVIGAAGPQPMGMEGLDLLN